MNPYKNVNDRAPAYEQRSATWYQIVIILLLLGFITFGLWIAGVVMAFNNVQEIEPTRNSVIIEGATIDDLPLQQTKNGAELQGSSPCLQGTCYEL